MKLLVTGGAGFIGSNYVRWVLDHTDDEVTVYDALTYAGNRSTLADVEEAHGSRFAFVHADICDLDAFSAAVAGHDAVVHFAAESHVDRSITGPAAFTVTNCVGTNVVMHACRLAEISRVLHISTDEVYGSVEEGDSVETDPLDPRSPYSASKAGSDLIALSYWSTYGLPVLVTRSSNNFGPWQYPEKVIPLFATNLLDGGTVPLYGDGLNRRDWLHVADNCAGVDAVLRRGGAGEIYNLGAGNELSNVDLTHRLLALAGAGDESIDRVADRLGHDRRYSVDSTKARALGWAPQWDLDDALADTFAWYRDKPVVVGAAEGRNPQPVKVLVTGAGGQLGTDLVAAFERPGHHDVLGATRAEMDLADRGSVLGAITGWVPELIVNAGAWTAVDACEGDPDRAWQVNALGARHVAEGATRVGAHLVHVSTDYVFDGTAAAPYTEWDPTGPASVYGRSKLAGEQEVLGQVPGATVVRTSWVCGVHGANMLKTVLRLSGGGGPLRFVDDQHGCPTFTADLASMLYRLGVDRRPGLYHVTNQGATTWYQFARDVVAAAGRDAGMVEPIRTVDLDPPRPAPRPANSVLDNAALRLGGVDLLPDHHEPLASAVAMLLG